MDVKSELLPKRDLMMELSARAAVKTRESVNEERIAHTIQPCPPEMILTKGAGFPYTSESPGLRKAGWNNGG
jgi:hypothetical protein